MKDTAYYQPGPYWTLEETGWIKSLLLFFDDVAILLPGYMYGRHFAADSVLAAPLEERGLLHVLEPKDWLDQETATRLAEIIFEMLANGDFDDLPEMGYFAELSQSRLGYASEVELASFLVDELQQRGLAMPSEDGVSIPLHPTVRTTILVILGQLSRDIGQRRGMKIHPTTNHVHAVSDLIKTMSMQAMPSRQHVVQLNMEPVAFDLSPIPLDDVLQFRAEHHVEYRTYRRDLRRFMFELDDVDEPANRETLLLERRQEIADQARDLQHMTRHKLRKNLGDYSLGIAGAAWSVSTSDPVGTALSVMGLIPDFKSSGRKCVDAYTYIFDIGKTCRA